MLNNMIVGSGGQLYINNNLSIPTNKTITIESGGKIHGNIIVSRWYIKYNI